MRPLKRGMGASVKDAITREAIVQLEDAMLDANDALARVGKNQAPSGGGNTPLVPSTNLADYLYLPGRVGGQVLTATSSTKGLTINQTDSVDADPLLRVTVPGGTLFSVRGYGPSSTPAVSIGNNFSTSNPTLTLTGRFKHQADSGDYIIAPSSAYINVLSSEHWSFNVGLLCSFLQTTTLYGAIGTTTRNLTLGTAASDVVLQLNTPTGQLGDLQQWCVNAGTLAKVDKDGNITAPTITATTGFSGPITLATLTTRGDLLTRDASSQVRLPIGSAGKFLKSDGTDPSWATPASTDLSDSAALVRWTGGGVFGPGDYLFDSDLGATLVLQTGDPTATGFGIIRDTTTNQDLVILLDANIISPNSLTFPSVGGIVVTTTASQPLSAKTLAVDCLMRVNSSTAGAAFMDTTVTTKKLRMVTTGSAANTNNALAVVTSGSRTQTFREHTGDVVLVGNTTAAAGVLGKSDLTAQTANIGATTLLTSSANSSGLFRLTFYVTCTTAGQAGDNVKVTVAYNDGTAQTVDVPFWPAAAAAPVVSQTVPLDNVSLNLASFGSVTVYSAASNAITYTTTMTNAGGTPDPQYTLRARIEALG